MRFEHLIEINDPLNPLIDPLSRDELWRGFELYAEDPAHFGVGLDACTVTQRAPGRLERELRFGKLVVNDVVHMTDRTELQYEIRASPHFPAGTRTIRLEEPEPGLLFVRFIYLSSPQGHQAGTEAERDVLHRAYVEADIDVIRYIRALAAEGEL